MNRLRTNLSVGLFLLVGMLILTYFTLQIGKGTFGKGYPVRLLATFRDAVGVEPRTPVKVAGVKVGEVQSVTLSDHEATVVLGLSEGIQISAGTQARIKTQGLLGETYIALVPGETSGPPLTSGATLGRGHSPIEVDDLLKGLIGVADDVKAITGTLKTALARKETEESIVEIVRSIRDLTSRLQEIVASNEERFNRLIENAESLSGDARGVVAENREGLRAIIANLKTVSETLSKVLATREGDLEGTIGSIHEASRKLDETMTSIQSISGKIDRGEGTLGRLVNDKSLATQAEDVLEGAGKLFTLPDRLVAEFGFSAEYLARGESFKNHVGVRIQPRVDRFYLLEVVSNPLREIHTSTTVQQTVIEGNPPFTTGEPPYVFTTTTKKEQRNKNSVLFTAEIAQRFDRYVVRGGIIESTGGFGGDAFFLDDKLRFSFDAFDFSGQDRERPSPNLKLEARWTFYPNLFLIAGAHDVLNDPTGHKAGRDALLGLGFEFTDDDLKQILLKAPLPSF